MLETAALMLCLLASVLQPNSRSLFYPWKVMVAWTEEEGGMSIRWSTDLPVLGAKVRYREDCFGGQPGEWRHKRSKWEMKQKSAWMIWECVHTVVLRDLSPLCAYEYQVGSGFMWSPLSRISGRTPFLNSHPDTQPARLLVLGDLGLSPYSQLTKAAIRSYLSSHSVDAVLHTGDIAYGLDDHGGKVGDEYLDSLEGIANLYPYMVIPGNHEAPDNFTHYKWRFRMPVTEANQATNFFYSFNLGRGHFIALNTEIWAYDCSEAAQTQANWLLADLEKAANRRSEVPWLLAFGHKPLYCSVDWTRPLHEYKCNVNCWAETAAMRRRLEPVFEQFGLDVYIASHVHRYERMSPIQRNTTVPSGKDSTHSHVNARAPLYILSGTGGNNHGPDDVATTPQLWSRFQTAESGFGVLTIFNKTHLLWEQYESATKTRVDYVWVIKS